MADQGDRQGNGRCKRCRKIEGDLFTGLDQLAFALEMEASERLSAGEGEEALRLENQRLGVRLAQRLVADVWADEVHARIERWRGEYESRLNAGEAVGAGVERG